MIRLDTPAAIDLLTGAFGPRLFEAELARLVGLARASEEQLAVLYVDVDELLELNDLHGEENLNEALAILAELICQVSGGVGPLGRVAGGSFALVLPRVGPSRALAIAERIRIRAAEAHFDGEEGGFHLTVSVGIASLRRGEPWGNLIEAAEEACRRAKIAGRNRVAVR